MGVHAWLDIFRAFQIEYFPILFDVSFAMKASLSSNETKLTVLFWERRI